MTGLPIVLVHGMRLSGSAWSPVAARLGEEFRAVDLPGHGARRGEVFTMDAATATVAAAVDELGGRALVVGHSLGGYVSMAAAARHPERIAGLVVAGATMVPGRGFGTPFRLMHRFLSTRPDDGDGLSRWIFGRVLPPESRDAALAGGIATEVIPDILTAVSGFDVLDGVASFPGRTWFVNGGHDHFRWHEGKFLAAAAHGRLVVVPGAGHYLPMTHPVAMARLVSDAAAVVRPERAAAP
ncbi:alpha/beta fold hydrolase [Amycolatopsis sp. CA-230715]|uniref:alpha/beta fold hydrolase n=1 Tax=Amycolatopsis sp. CA-230715 TaxID=2745196 RepID=UPI001C012289|nr:alpha/beta hydrolase [Amycolatopsis sp. CA-230715]QWF85048.1 2-succinyl-6-hydroxy-2,4-cyclohexadiene-1-carboxylate synthase [Amycolatopsis sp. CA-230715]